MRKSVQFLLLFLMCISASWTWASDAPERTVLFNMGDYDSQYWRIPALVTAADNSLVAVVDKRGSSLGDLPNTISIMSRRSTDNGKNWSEPVVVAQGGNGKTYGDPAVVLDKKTGNLICMFVGDQGLWNATPSQRQGIYVSKSTDNGVSWSEPVAIDIESDECSTEVVSGTGIPENTRLTVVAEPADGYQLKEIRVNDVALERNVNIFTLTQETTVTAEFEEAVPAYCTYEGNSSHDQRYVRSITMNGGTSPFSVSVYSTTRQAVYVDKTDNVFEAYAGEEIQPVVNWAGEWMHGYLYIDYDKDYTFSYTLGSDDYPTADGELVSYTFYSPSDSQWGKNSKGETTENNSRLDDVPSFTLPESLAPGEYRVRLKIDWCHLDPCGHPDEIANTLTGNGGNIVDFTLRIVERPATYTVTLPETVENGTLTVMNGSVALVPGANTVEENSELTITATPNEGYNLASLTVNGEDITSGETHTVTGATEISVTFEAKPTHTVTYSVVEGEGSIILTSADGTQSYESGEPIEAGTSFRITFDPAEDYKVGRVMYGPSQFGAIMELTLASDNSYTMPAEQFVGNYTFEAYFVYDPETGIAENDREAISARYVSGVLHVEGVTDGEFEVNIYNLTGKLVRTAIETTVDVADLAKGCYLVKVTTAEAEKVVKFIKK